MKIFFLGKEIVKGGRVDHKKEIEEAKKCMDRVGLDCSPKTLISELSVAKKTAGRDCESNIK